MRFVVVVVAALMILGLAAFGLVSAQKGDTPTATDGLNCARRFGDTERTCSPRPCAGQSNCSSDGFRSGGNPVTAPRSTAGGRADPPRPDDACSGLFGR